MNRRKRATKSGAGGNSTSTCRYFKELSFLMDVVGVRVTQSNIQTDLFTPPASPLPENNAPLVSPVINAPPTHQPSSNPHRLSPSMTRNTSSSKSSSITESPMNTMRSTLQNRRPHLTNKRKNDNDSLQLVLEKAITADLEKSKEVVKDDDPDELFCKSFVSSLKGLSKKKNKRAKIKMMQILLDMESDSDS